MAWLPNPIACDVCGAVKQPSNHWWYVDIQTLATVAEAHLRFAQENPAQRPAAGPYFSLRPWDMNAEDRSRPYKHICGQVCAIRLLNEFMNGEGNPEQHFAIKPDETAAALPPE